MVENQNKKDEKAKIAKEPNFSRKENGDWGGEWRVNGTVSKTIGQRITIVSWKKSGFNSFYLLR